jgi:hypothetical protein
MATAAQAPAKQELKIVSHSGLFYWWPVWAVGYLMAAITWFDGTRLATVPAKGTELYPKATAAEVTYYPDPKDQGKKVTTKITDQDLLVAPEKADGKMSRPGPLMTSSKSPGVLWAIVVLLVITITNIPLRGLWSVIVIIVIIMLAVILALMGVWDTILETFSLLDIRINFGGYFFIATVLLGIWLTALLFFDQQVYMVFTPGQFRVRLEIGEGETAYDTTGMTIQKQRSDLFRHWILGLGSGDLIVRTSGAQAHHFDLPNVLFLGSKVKQIEEMLRARPVVAAPTPAQR